MIRILGEAEVLALLRELKTRLRARIGDRLERVVLFGSYARGRVSEESDIDVLLLVRGLTEADKWAAAEEAASLMMRERVVLSVLCLDVEEYQRMLAREKTLALDVEREGVPL
ncbi:MAG: nucleotidyltransferase domain-containing protein [Myxococcales bacterium]|nr:nucleotidyltransferase domain-containing protein [Myxococcales bacterium]